MRQGWRTIGLAVLCGIAFPFLSAGQPGQAPAPLVECPAKKPVPRTQSDLIPSAEVSRTVSIRDPVIDLSYDIRKDKQRILEHFENTLVFSRHSPRIQRSPSSWSAGGVSFKFEPLSFPNLRLCKLYLVPFSTTTGEPPEDISRHRLRVQHPAFDDWTSLRFEVGEAPEPPQTYQAAAVVQLPENITTFEFTAADKAGWRQSKDGLNLRVLRFEKDAVDLQILEAKKHLLVVRNEAGSRLLPVYPFRPADGEHTVKYHGIVHSAELYAVPEFQRTEKRFSFTLAERNLLDSPTTGLRTRGEKPSIALEDEYRSLDEATFAAIEPTWFGDAASPKKPRGITLAPPGDAAPGKLGLRTKTKLGIIGEEGLLPIRFIKSEEKNGRIEFEIPSSRTSRLVGISGEVSISGQSDFKVVRIEHPGHSNLFTQAIEDLGIKVTAKFDRNHFKVHCTAGSFTPTNAVSIRVLDKDGVQLRSGAVHRKKDFYWGIPERAELLFARKKFERSVPVEFLFDPAKKQIFDKGKSDAASLWEMIPVLSGVSSVVRFSPVPSGHYSTGIADDHYAYRDKEYPSATGLLSKEIAHADPAGAKRFGYEVKPFKGYTFAILNKRRLADGSLQEAKPQGDITRHWAKGSFQTEYYTSGLNSRPFPVVVATPEDPSKISLVYTMTFREVLFHDLGGKKLEEIPAKMTESGWKLFK